MNRLEAIKVRLEEYKRVKALEAIEKSKEPQQDMFIPESPELTFSPKEGICICRVGSFIPWCPHATMLQRRMHYNTQETAVELGDDIRLRDLQTGS